MLGPMRCAPVRFDWTDGEGRAVACFSVCVDRGRRLVDGGGSSSADARRVDGGAIRVSEPGDLGRDLGDSIAGHLPANPVASTAVRQPGSPYLRRLGRRFSPRRHRFRALMLVPVRIAAPFTGGLSGAAAGAVIAAARRALGSPARSWSCTSESIWARRPDSARERGVPTGQRRSVQTV